MVITIQYIQEPKILVYHRVGHNIGDPFATVQWEIFKGSNWYWFYKYAQQIIFINRSVTVPFKNYYNV